MLSGPLAQAKSQNHLVDNIRLVNAQILTLESIGFTSAPYSLAIESLKGEWSDIALPSKPMQQIILESAQNKDSQPSTMVSWYRLPIRDLGQLKKPWYLYLPRWKSEGSIAIYSGSRLIYQSHSNVIWNGWNYPLFFALNEASGTKLPSELIIRIQHFHGYGGALSSVSIGSYEALHWRYQVRQWLQVELPYLTGAAILAMGMFSFYIWLRRKHETLYLLFFAVATMSWLRSLHFHQGLEQLPISDAWFGWLTISSLFWLVLASHLFICHMHQRPQLLLTRAMLALTIAVSLLLPLFSTFAQAHTIAPLAYISLLVMGNLLFAFGIYNSWGRTRSGMALATWGLISLQFGLWDWLIENNFISLESIYLGSYSNIGGFLLITIFMYKRYIGAIRDVEASNETLALRLQRREAELAGIHQRLREADQLETLRQERQRLTQDMHDGLGSALVSALRVVEHGSMNEAAIAQVLKGCIDDLKLTIDSLEPLEADLLLLLATLRFRLGPRLESTGIKLYWEIQDVPELGWLSPRNSLHILRILQEAFTNILKHTKATEVRLATALIDDCVLVTISDNGQGFDTAQGLINGGKGLTNQMRRAESIGGNVTWESTQQGTRFSLWLPVNNASSFKLASGT